MGLGTVSLGQTEQIERNRTAVFSQTDTTDNQSEEPRLHRHFLFFFFSFFFSCHSPLLLRLPNGRGIAGIFLSTKPAYMLCTAGNFPGLKSPQIALFTWLSPVMSMIVSFCAVLFPMRCLG